MAYSNFRYFSLSFLSFTPSPLFSSRNDKNGATTLQGVGIWAQAGYLKTHGNRNNMERLLFLSVYMALELHRFNAEKSGLIYMEGKFSFFFN